MCHHVYKDADQFQHPGSFLTPTSVQFLPLGYHSSDFCHHIVVLLVPNLHMIRWYSRQSWVPCFFCSILLVRFNPYPFSLPFSWWWIFVVQFLIIMNKATMKIHIYEYSHILWIFMCILWIFIYAFVDINDLFFLGRYKEVKLLG